MPRPSKAHLILCVFPDPTKRLQFKQFVNTSERRQQTEVIEERGQKRPADWPKTSGSLRFTPDQFVTPKHQWTWQTVAKKGDMVLNDQATTSVAVKYGDTQLAVYHVPRRGLYASQQMYVSCLSFSFHLNLFCMAQVSPSSRFRTRSRYNQ